MKKILSLLTIVTLGATTPISTLCMSLETFNLVANKVNSIQSKGATSQALYDDTFSINTKIADVSWFDTVDTTEMKIKKIYKVNWSKSSYHLIITRTNLNVWAEGNGGYFEYQNTWLGDLDVILNIEKEDINQNIAEGYFHNSSTILVGTNWLHIYAALNFSEIKISFDAINEAYNKSFLGWTKVGADYGIRVQILDIEE